MKISYKEFLKESQVIILEEDFNKLIKDLPDLNFDNINGINPTDFIAGINDYTDKDDIVTSYFTCNLPKNWWCYNVHGSSIKLDFDHRNPSEELIKELELIKDSIKDSKYKIVNYDSILIEIKECINNKIKEAIRTLSDEELEILRKLLNHENIL